MTLTNEILNMKIAYLPFSMRVRNTLLNVNIKTVNDLYRVYKNNGLLDKVGCGGALFKEVKRYFDMLECLPDHIK